MIDIAEEIVIGFASEGGGLSKLLKTIKDNQGTFYLSDTV